MLNEDKICRLEALALKNCLRLHLDSCLLFKQNSIPTAFALSIIALEEFGKVLILDELIYHHRVGENLDIGGEDDYIRMIHNHKDKQVWCLGHAYSFYDKYRRELNAVTKGKFEIQKQNALYVGLENKTLKGRIIDPSKISRDKAKDKIILINEILLEMAILKLKQGEFFDGEYVDKLINKSLLNKLNRIGLFLKNIK